MLHEGRDAMVVDPGDAKPMSDALGHGDLQLAAILVTHRPHADDVRHIANFLPANARDGAAGDLAYTLANPRYARAAEPGDADLDQYTAPCKSLRARGESTLPSQLATRRRVNPFLRSREATVMSQAIQTEVFPALRQWNYDFQ